MKVFQHIDEYHSFDGIGNDCRGFRDIFQSLSIENSIITQRNFCSNEESILLVHNLKQSHFNSLGINQKSIHILHYGGSGYPLEFFLSLPGRKFLRFHNVTPPEFYLGCNESVYISMDKFYTKSVLELFSMSSDIELAICDSNTNAEFLRVYSSIPTTTIPILRDYQVAGNLVSSSKNELFKEKLINKDLVFVGRIVPNKKIQDIIILFYFWQQEHPDSQLHLIGGLVPGIDEYFHFLQDLIKDLELSKNVKIHLKLDEQQKSKVLQKSLFYISMSEHEGFGIPLLEAMQNQLAVIAFSSSAVPETMKRGGVLFKKKDFISLIELMNQIIQSPHLYFSILQTQNKAIQYYQNYPFQEKIKNIILKQEFKTA